MDHRDRPANEQAFDGIVIATDASNAQRLLSDADTGMTLPPLTYEAITSCYLQYAPGTSLPRPMYALLDDPRNSNGDNMYLTAASCMMIRAACLQS
jgi:predicted NAD/FAD-dependent oxidoreductase